MSLQRASAQLKRSYRLAQLAEEERAWREHVARLAEVQPELTPLLIAYVTQERQLPASLLDAVSPQTA